MGEEIGDVVGDDVSFRFKRDVSNIVSCNVGSVTKSDSEAIVTRIGIRQAIELNLCVYISDFFTNMFKSRFSKFHCDKVTSGLSSISFFLLALGFFVTILVNHKLATDDISFYFHNDKHVYEEFVFSTEENPAIICLIASVIYCILGCVSLRESWTEKTLVFGEAADAFLFPILLCALVLLTDFLHIFFMTFIYVIFSVGMHEIDSKPNEGNIGILRVVSISFAVFWIGYFVGMYFNCNKTQPVYVIAQIAVLGIWIYDLYRVEQYGSHVDYHFFIKTGLRVILLLVVFLQQFT